MTAAPPPLDHELAEPLRAVLDRLPMPLTPALIADRRARTAAGALSDEAIRRDGAFAFEERLVPGPPGETQVRLIICRPTATSGPHPAVYNTHGGGMVAGNHRTVERACELIDNGRLSDKQIAATLGFCDEFHFSKKFKQTMGVPPRGYRRRVAADGHAIKPA